MTAKTEQAGILSWLDRDDWPGDFYELLGRKRFDPDIATMCDEVTAGAREVLPYQTHADPAKAMRAMRLLTEFVGRAADVLGAAEKVGEENARLYGELRDRWVAENGEDASAWKSDALSMWLSEEAGVHDKAVGEIAKLFAANDQDAAQKSSTVIHPEIADEVARPVMPIILDAEPAPAAPVILEPAIVEEPEPKPAAPVILPAAEKPRPAAKPKAKPPAMPKSAERPAAKPRPPKQPAPAERRVEPAYDAEPPSRKPVALIAMMIGLPVLLLAAALIWKFYPSGDGDKSTASKKSKTGKTDGNNVAGKTNDDKTDGNNVAVKTPSQRFAELLAAAKQTRGDAAARAAYGKALAVATTTSQKAQVYADLASDDGYIASLSTNELRDAMDALSRDSIYSAKIGSYANGLKTAEDVKSVLNHVHQQLAAGRDRIFTERMLAGVLQGATAVGRLSVDDLILEYLRAYKALSSIRTRQSLILSLPTVLARRKKTIDGLKKLTAIVEKAVPNAPSGMFLKKLFEVTAGNSSERNPAEREAVYAAAAALGTNTSSSLSRRVMVSNLRLFARRQGSVSEAAKFFKQRLTKAPLDKAAAEFSTAFVDDALKEAKKKSGAERVRAIQEVWQLAGDGAPRVKLALAIVADDDFTSAAGFDAVLKFYEAIIAYASDPKNRQSDYIKSARVKALIRFVNKHKKLDELEKQYIAQLATSKDKVVPQAVINEIAKTRVKSLRPRLGSAWLDKDHKAVAEALKRADDETKSAEYNSLMSDVGFVRSLTFKEYLLTEEKIIAGTTNKVRITAIIGSNGRMTRYLNSVRAKNPKARVQAIIGRWKSARVHLRGRLEEDKDNQAAKSMLDAVERALSAVERKR